MTALAMYVFAVGAALTDVKNNKIYNVYLLPGIAGALFIRLFGGGGPALLGGILGMAGILAVLLPVYLLKGLRAGDVKLLSALSAFTGFRQGLVLVGVAFVLCAAYGILRLVVTRRLSGTVHFAVPVLCALLLMQAGGAA